MFPWLQEGVCDEISPEWGFSGNNKFERGVRKEKKNNNSEEI